MAENFGKYRLHEKIAQGGMAEVFLATRQGEFDGFEQRLAIKRMYPHLVDQDDVINMFIDEARIASRLHHSNIVQIYDLGVVDGTFFIAMEYVEGLDLRRSCELGIEDDNFISRPLAVHIASEIAAGLAHAHGQTDENGNPMNIIHRDISPQNVLLSVDGAVKICDFGIAKAESRLTQTRVGEFKGKFSYMSPEQFGHGDLDQRSDIFTLGIVLYETTVAARLFQSKNEYEAMQKITNGDFRSPSSVRPDYPPRLEEIVMKALAVDADQRYQTAKAMQDDLEDWLHRQRVRVGPRQLATYVDELRDAIDDVDAGEVDRQITETDVDVGPSTSAEESTRVETPSPRRQGDESSKPVDETDQMTVSVEELARLDSQSAERDEEGVETDPTLSPQSFEGDDTTIDESISDDHLQGPDTPKNDGRRTESHQRSGSTPGSGGGQAASVEIQGRSSTSIDEELKDDTTSPVVIDEQTVDERLTVSSSTTDDDDVEEWEKLETKVADSSASSGGGRESSTAETSSGASTTSTATRQPITEQHQLRSDPVDTFDGEGVDEPAERPSPALDGTDDDSEGPLAPSVDEVPDLRPGGRELTGLREMGAPSEIDDAEETVRTVGDELRDHLVRLERRLPFELSRRALIVGATAGMTVIMGLVVWGVVTIGDDEPDDPQEVEDAVESVVADPIGEREVVLDLETDPPGANVIANGLRHDEETPTSVGLVDGVDNEIWLARDGYRPQRISVPADGGSLDYTIELERGTTTETTPVAFRSSPPGAEVFVDGHSIGRTPVRFDNAPVDFEMHVQYERDGYRPFVGFFDLEAGVDADIDTELVADEDVEFVRGRYGVRPEGSRISVGGEHLGETPLDVDHRSGDWLAIEVANEGRYSERRRFRLDRIGGFELGTELGEEVGETGRISVDVEPLSQAFVDGRALGMAPIEELSLPPGEHTVMFETEDGARVDTSLRVVADDHRSYRVDIDGEQLEVVATD